MAADLKINKSIILQTDEPSIFLLIVFCSPGLRLNLLVLKMGRLSQQLLRNAVRESETINEILNTFI